MEESNNKMKLKEATLEELKQILREDFEIELNRGEVEKIAHTLIGYFELLTKIYYKRTFENSSAGLIAKVTKDK